MPFDNVHASVVRHLQDSLIRDRGGLSLSVQQSLSSPWLSQFLPSRVRYQTTPTKEIHRPISPPPPRHSQQATARVKRLCFRVFFFLKEIFPSFSVFTAEPRSPPSRASSRTPAPPAGTASPLFTASHAALKSGSTRSPARGRYGQPRPKNPQQARASRAPHQDTLTAPRPAPLPAPRFPDYYGRPPRTALPGRPPGAMAEVAARRAVAVGVPAGGGEEEANLGAAAAAAAMRGCGEVDTSSPFQSVRQALDLFGGGAAAVSQWRHPQAPPPVQLRPEVS